MAGTDTTPTGKTYTELDRAYVAFNVALFDGDLPGCLITLTRRRRSQGFIKLGQFCSSDRSETTDEIGLNPQRFDGVPDDEIQALLVRLMCHQWRAYQDRPPKKPSYCDEVTASKLESLGLVPTDTGKPGGRRTGSNIGHYIIEDGLFAGVAAARKFDRDRLFYDLSKEQDPRERRNKATFTCPLCKIKRYGDTPKAPPLCGSCSVAALGGAGFVDAIPLLVVMHSPESAAAVGYAEVSVEDLLAPADAPAPVVSYEPPEQHVAPLVTDPPWPLQPPVEPAKRKRGRPKGSKNKPKPLRGRPPKRKRGASYEAPKRKRGRPKGSRNRPARIAA